METIEYLIENTLGLSMLVGMAGLLIGSFLNVLIARLPIMLIHEENNSTTSKRKPKKFNLFFPRSHCPSCKKNIPLWCNIPVLSFIFLRGKCLKCGKKISWRYPCVEILSSLIAVYVTLNFGLTWAALAAAIFSWILISLFFIDCEHQLLPDNLTLNLMWLGLIGSAYGFFLNPENAILGAALGYTSLWSIAKIFHFFRGVPGMGHGDFKLFAALGAWLGWQILPLVLLAAALGGSLYGLTIILLKKQDRTKPIAFGPFLSLAGWLAFFFGHEFMGIYFQWYFN